ncbi:emp24/gp25L/p24 family/GOLD [Candidatus Methanoperedens nitroreducens]|uniref:Emp24/gp25L/p24 family/GOLD n=1 Tax=Candidatus Methanoperedens nitratireducens TaxID=1392998 RepID=A0A062UZI3_9EURY|nr:emp24/gp25L/p24 family protein [Candidatus Methanoperedens nitroreducens]KCZ72336.1 emp24/gp25L/p24 family/GOLD [Candidatus Methanoperedens nitroreducens]MDJ1423730.1 emp24/gp25L/p24 family protein [Candidatus Methanoperedens sp.]
MKKILLIILIILGVLVAGCSGPIGSSNKQTSTIVNEQFTISANSVKGYYSDLQTGDELEVSITVLQGGDLDIDFYITNADGAKIISRSKIGDTTISWVAPSSGTYYFKYDNSFSALTSKIVKTTITVTR